MILPQDLVNGIFSIIGTPRTLDALDKAGKLAWFKSAVVELDTRGGFKQKLDDAIKLGPGLEQMSDLALDYIFEEALPAALTEIAEKIDTTPPPPVA